MDVAYFLLKEENALLPISTFASQNSNSDSYFVARTLNNANLSWGEIKVSLTWLMARYGFSDGLSRCMACCDLSKSSTKNILYRV